MRRRQALLAALAAVSLHRLATAAEGDPPPWVEGEVRKVDRAQGKLTLRHGPIPHLDMPAMTMVFRVADPALLDGLQPGDKRRFVFARVDGAYTVTAVEAPK